MTIKISFVDTSLETLAGPRHKVALDSLYRQAHAAGLSVTLLSGPGPWLHLVYRVEK